MQIRLIRRTVIAILFSSVFSYPVLAATDKSLKLHYEFGPTVNEKVLDVTGNGYDAILMNAASVRQLNSIGLLDLGSANGYLDLGNATGTLIASLTDFTISTYLYIDPMSNIGGDGNFVWAFSTLDACGPTTGNYISLSVNAP